MNANHETNQDLPQDFKIGDDLMITKQTRRATVGGTWVTGKLNGHNYQVLVFPEHAECESYELGDSRISKLWLQWIADKQIVANFDRGWDCQPIDATAQMIVDFLGAGLAEYVFGK
jgi:hypothetical protein